MSQNQFVAKIQTPDGVLHDSKQAAVDHLRKPAIKAAMTAVAGGKAELADWLITHQEQVEIAFETGTIRRVTKTESNQLAKALEALKKVEGVPGIKFLQENTGAIADSFRWPSVKRMDEAEKATVARNTLVAASEGNEELASWVIANKDAILAAYEAGVQKREVSPKASEALAAYQAKKSAEALAAATAAGPEALAAYHAKVAEKAAAKAANKA